ncbi:MAG: hypothetical protein Q8P24_17080, partial [Desulfobacterales bacterium]|nr:hypothetical protein [Desulfobacterales bacterium]
CDFPGRKKTAGWVHGVFHWVSVLLEHMVSLGFTQKLIHNFGRFRARMAGRENAGISRYSEFPQRSHTGCIGV